MSEAELTRTQRRVLQALRYVAYDGWPARVRDIQDAAQIASPSTVHRALQQLEERGLVRKHPRYPRGGWLPSPLLR